MTTLSRASLDAPAFSPVFQQQSMSLADELRQAKGEVELLKTMVSLISNFIRQRGKPEGRRT
jgi:hypothetical protein